MGHGKAKKKARQHAQMAAATATAAAAATMIADEGAQTGRISQSPALPHHTTMGRQQQPKQPELQHTHAPSWLSDPILGVSLTEAVANGVPYFIRQCDYDASRHAGAQVAPPRTLHRIQAEDSGIRAERLKNAPKGCVWTPQTARYFSPVLPRTVAEEKGRWLRWWEVSYVLSRMYVRMGKATVDTVLMVERDGRSLAAVATETQHSIAWMTRKIGLSRTLAASYFNYHVHTTASHQQRPYRDQGAQQQQQSA